MCSTDPLTWTLSQLVRTSVNCTWTPSSATITPQHASVRATTKYLIDSLRTAFTKSWMSVDIATAVEKTPWIIAKKGRTNAKTDIVRKRKHFYLRVEAKRAIGCFVSCRFWLNSLLTIRFERRVADLLTQISNPQWVSKELLGVSVRYGLSSPWWLRCTLAIRWCSQVYIET